MIKGGCVYYLTNWNNKVLYIGVTSNLQVRLPQHITKEFPESFTAKYNCNKLVHYEVFSSIQEAIARETTVKRWKRAWKDELITKSNPEWKDLGKEVMSW